MFDEKKFEEEQFAKIFFGVHSVFPCFVEAFMKEYDLHYTLKSHELYEKDKHKVFLYGPDENVSAILYRYPEHHNVDIPIFGPRMYRRDEQKVRSINAEYVMVISENVESQAVTTCISFGEMNQGYHFGISAIAVKNGNQVEKSIHGPFFINGDSHYDNTFQGVYSNSLVASTFNLYSYNKESLQYVQKKGELLQISDFFNDDIGFGIGKKPNFGKLSDYVKPDETLNVTLSELPSTLRTHMLSDVKKY